MLEREDGRYANSAATELFLDPAKPSYIGGFLEMLNARCYCVGSQILPAVPRGRRWSGLAA